MLTDLPAANVDNEAVKMNPCRDTGNNGETKSSRTFDNYQINYITSRPKHHYVACRRLQMHTLHAKYIQQ